MRQVSLYTCSFVDEDSCSCVFKRGSVCVGNALSTKPFDRLTFVSLSLTRLRSKLYIDLILVTPRVDLGRLNTTLCTALTSSEARADLLSKEITQTHGTHVAGLSSLSKQNSIDHLSTMDAIGLHRQDLGRLRHDVEALGQTSASHMALSQHTASTAREDADEISLAIASMSGKVDSLSSISQVQYETLQGMLRQLIAAQAPREPVDHHKDRKAATSSWQTTDEKPTENIEGNQKERFGKLQEPSEHLSESISRLWSLASTKDATYHSEDAQNIIHDLGELISAALDIAKRTPQPSRNLKRSADFDQKDAESSHTNERDLKRVRGLIAASPSLRITKKGMYFLHRICWGANL